MKVWIYPPVQQKQSYLNVGLEALLPVEFSPPFKGFSNINLGLFSNLFIVTLVMCQSY